VSSERRAAPWRWLAAVAPLALLHPGLRHAIESRMALHMLLEFPLLLASGWALARLLGRRGAWLDGLDAHGLLGITVASCVSAFWMIPAALDLALLQEPMRWAKLASWIVAGALLARSLPRLGNEVGVFFVGNLAWMLASAGMLYRESESRLCVNYLAADQVWAGNGLIALAIVLAALALRRLAAPGADLTSSRAAAAPPRSSSSDPTAGRRPVRP
jgi:hypothetical protein